MKFAAFYGRYSCERQSEQSIEGQMSVCQKYAEQNGLKIAPVLSVRLPQTRLLRRNYAFLQELLKSDCVFPRFVVLYSCQTILILTKQVTSA